MEVGRGQAHREEGERKGQADGKRAVGTEVLLCKEVAMRHRGRQGLTTDLHRIFTVLHPKCNITKGLEPFTLLRRNFIVRFFRP